MANPQQMKMIRQIQKMQADMSRAQEELAATTVEGSAGGGLVRATVTGTGKVVKITIDPKAVDPDDVEMLEDLVLAAVNEGMREASEMQSNKIGPISSGVDLGSFGGLLG